MYRYDETHPAATNTLRSRWRRRLLVLPAMAALTLASATTAAATDPVPTPEPADPTPQVCVSLTSLASFTTSGGPFQGGTTLRWNVNKGCPEVTIKLAGQAVAATSSKVVDPEVGTEYQLTASLGAFSKQLGTQIALGGDTVDYVPAARGFLASMRNSTDPAAVEAARLAGPILSTLSPAAKRSLLGEMVEIHVIPWNYSLTSLPPFRFAADLVATHGQPYTTIRGAALRELFNTNRAVIAVGEEELVRIASRSAEYAPGHVVSHELGHAVLHHAAPEEKPNVEAAYNATPEDTPRFSNYLRKRSTDFDQYFAIGTSALFRYPEWHTGMERYDYSPEGLAERNPQLLTILRRIFPGAG
jgi:hypothetical protein